MPLSTPSIFRPPQVQPRLLPERADIVVVGAGLTGLSIAQRLKREGIDAIVLERRDDPASGMATRGMGIVSTQLLDPPFRLIEAVGLDRATQILHYSLKSGAGWKDFLQPSGVAYATKGEQEHGEVEKNLEALRRLNIPARPWHPDSDTGLLSGWFQPDGGTLDLGAVCASLADGIRIYTRAAATEVIDQGMDLAVCIDTGERVRCDLVIMAGGVQITAWTADKFHAIRHQSIATAPAERMAEVPLSIQYGYSQLRQLDDGTVVLSGCRWATPHMEVGETDDTIINEAIHRGLVGFLHRHWPALKTVPVIRQWTGIMTASCDGLPIVGPLPGRPRIVCCGGFGGYSASLALRSADAVVEGITTGTSTEVPACFSTHRFG